MRSASLDILRILARESLPPAELARRTGRRAQALKRLLSGLEVPGWISRGAETVQAARAFDFLDAQAIAARFGTGTDCEVAVLDACESTNTRLIEGSAAGDGSKRATALLAEEQTAGRGRRGRRWFSSIGGSLALSVRCRLQCPPRELSGLSLVAGVATARALHGLGATDVRLKWPNDLLIDGAKVGGILVETRIERGAVRAVIGLGLNVRSGAGFSPDLRRRVSALDQVLDPVPSRNRIAASIIDSILAGVASFESGGFASVRERWEAMHAYQGRRLRIRLADGTVFGGLAEGLDSSGALLVRTRSGIRAVQSARAVMARAA